MLTCGGREAVFGGRASGRPATCRGGAGRRPASHGRPGRGRLRAEPAQAAGRRATAAGELWAEAGRAAALAHPTLAEDGVAEGRRPRVWRRAASSWTGSRPHGERAKQRCRG